MYTAINDYVIAEKASNAIASASGIILTAGEPRYKIIAVNEITKELLGKVVIGPANLIDNGFYYIDYKQIVAVVS